MKHNKLIFAILTFIILACFFIYIGSIITDFSANYPGHEWTLFLALLTSYFPGCAAIIAASYFVKYMIERKKNNNKLSHAINISRAVCALLVLIAWIFHYFFMNAYFVVNTILGVLIIVLFVAELVIWLVSLKKKA